MLVYRQTKLEPYRRIIIYVEYVSGVFVFYHLDIPIRLYYYIRRIALHVHLISYICIHSG